MRLLDRYTILDRIGSGGMATIYRATDDRLDRVVCIKLLRTTLIEGSDGNNTSGRAVFRATYSHFLQEALALSKLQHPNTLRIYDFGYLDDASPDPGAPFHVSEYLDGGNLETHIRLRGALPVDEVLAILENVSGALAEAHEHGIIHRDIKPSNILFARVRGTLVTKLADFGIAHSDLKKKQSAHGTNAFDGMESVSTVALFSPRWAAPEQLCGSPEGPRTDVYALGLVACFMLTGRVLFGDEDVRITFNDRVRGDALVTARLAQIGLTGGVGRVLAHALVARSDDRIATAPELFEHLSDALDTRTPIAPIAIELNQPQTPTAQQARQPSPQVVPPPPASAPLALEVESVGSGGRAQVQPAPEHVAQYGERRVRYVEVDEKLDLSFVDAQGGQVRVRVTILPGAIGSPQKLNVKGMTCFVSLRGQRPTPALTVATDGTAELVSSTRQVLGEVTWLFGKPSPSGEGRLFVVDGRQLLVPYSEAQLAIALMSSQGNDLVVMCRR
jgi:serine/threonine-protein kinase